MNNVGHNIWTPPSAQTKKRRFRVAPSHSIPPPPPCTLIACFAVVSKPTRAEATIENRRYTVALSATTKSTRAEAAREMALFVLRPKREDVKATKCLGCLGCLGWSINHRPKHLDCTKVARLFRFAAGLVARSPLRASLPNLNLAQKS